MAKKWELKAGEKNLVSAVTGIIKDLLRMKRGAKWFESFDTTFDFFQERVNIAPDHWKRNSDGEIKWKQAIRNAAKVKRKNKSPDALTQGELVAFEDGGFALPNYVPKHRNAVEFPNRGGFKPKLVKSKKKRAIPKPEPEREPDALPVEHRAIKAANRVRLLVRDIDEVIRDMTIQKIISDIEEGRWFFESRFKKKRRSPRVTDEDR